MDGYGLFDVPNTPSCLLLSHSYTPIHPLLHVQGESSAIYEDGGNNHWHNLTYTPIFTRPPASTHHCLVKCEEGPGIDNKAP